MKRSDGLRIELDELKARVSMAGYGAEKAEKKCKDLERLIWDIVFLAPFAFGAVAWIVLWLVSSARDVRGMSISLAAIGCGLAAFAACSRVASRGR